MSTTAELMNSPDATSDTPDHESDIVYQLEDRPPLLASFFAALQHVLASIVGIVTPPIIISNALGL